MSRGSELTRVSLCILCALAAFPVGCAPPDLSASEEDLIEGTSDLVAADDGSFTFVDDIRQWRRDSVVFVRFPGNDCSATLVAPRTLATASHCVGTFGSGPTMACFGAQNPSGTGALPAGMPPQQCFAVVGCATHQGSQRACGDGRTDANAQRDRDIAMLVLEQRFDHGQTGRRTQDFHVVPAQLVASDPGNDPSQWNSHPVRVVGYGPNGGCPETGVPGTFGPLRSVGGTSVRYGNVPLADITATIDLWAAVSMGGDSGGAVFVDRPDEDGPLQLLAVNTYTYFAALSPCPPYADGVDAHDRGTRVTYADVQSFLARFLGQRFLAPPPPPSMPAVAGELVWQAGVPALWLGDVNVAPVGEPERVGFVDPATGLAADVFDPDGDGLAGAADNCWGIRNDDQRLGDPTNPSLASCVRPSSGATVSYGCDPATSSAPGALETSIDPDGDRIPTPCDICPWVRDFDQRDRNGNGIGDACRCGDPRVPPGAPCDVDTDGDEYPDDVDNSEAFARRLDVA